MHFIQIALLVVLLSVCSCGDDAIVNYDCSPDGKTLDLCITGDEGAELYAKEQPKPKAVGFLHIYGIEDQSVLNYFNEVESVERLNVASSPGIKNFKWLKSLKKVKHFTVELNPNLVSFEGLENLTEIDPSPLTDLAFIQYNNKLESLKGLDNLARMPYGMKLDNNKSLKSIEQLKSLEVLNGLTVHGAGKMKVFPALPKLTEIEGLDIQYNPVLERIEPFPKLTSIVVGFRASNNPLFEDCSGEKFVALDADFNGRLFELENNKPNSKCADLE